MHSPIALWAGHFPLLLLLSGCVGTGLRSPGYLDLPPPQAEPDEAVSRVRALLQSPNPDLPRLLHAADLGNPRIAAARHAVGAAAGRAWQAELYPNPTLLLEAEEVPAGSPGLERSENTIGLRQPIVLGGRRSEALAVARAEGDARTLTLQQKRRDVAAEVRGVWVELVYLQAAEALTRELVQAARSTHQHANTRLAAQASPESEALKAEVEVERIDLKLRRMGRERQAALQRLAALVGLESLNAVRPAGELTASLPDLDLATLVGTLADHPGLLAAKAGIGVAQRQIDLAEAQWIPDVSLRFAYGRNNASDEQFLQGGLQIPLPLFDRNQGQIHEAEELAQERERTTEAMERRLYADLASVLADYASARDAAHTHSERIVPAAQRAFDQASAGYQAGRASFLDLLDAQRTLAQVRLSALVALRDAHRTLARLTQLTGPLAAR